MYRQKCPPCPMEETSYLQQHKKRKTRTMSYAQLLIQVGKVERQCGLADRTPDGKAWDLVSIPSCIVVRFVRGFLSAHPLMSKCSQSSPSVSFTGMIWKLAETAARDSQNDINKHKNVLVLKVSFEAAVDSLWAPNASLTQQVGS